MECFIQCCYVCIREACETALQEKHALDISRAEGFLDELNTSHLKQMENLKQVFMKAAEGDTRTEVTVAVFLDLSSVACYFIVLTIEMMLNKPGA